MLSILPMPHEVLRELCGQLNLDDPAPLWGWTASQGSTLQGYVVVARDEPCRILALAAEDSEVADGLLRAGLVQFYREGIRGYTFVSPPPLPLPPNYMIIGQGSMAVLFTPCDHTQEEC